METLESLKDKRAKYSELVAEMESIRGTETAKVVFRYCENYINELREQNDTVSLDQLLYNQGQLVALKKLCDVIMSGMGRRI